METGPERRINRNINGETVSKKRKRKKETVPKKRKPKMLYRERTLEDTYTRYVHPVKATLEKLSKKLGLTIDQLREWFRKRRLEADKVQYGTQRSISAGLHLSRLLDSKDINFEVGQLAETKTFTTGFRSAWFKCKIRDISVKENKILPDYYDFPGEEIRWAKIYERPPYGRSKANGSQLMVRPQYPQMYHKSEMPPVDSIAEVCVVIDGAWRVGDLVDWYEDDCYWSATITYLLSNDMVQIEFPKPPAGQGKIYKVFCKDLRPSLEWSPSKGWTLPYMIGPTSCSAQLIFPSPQDESSTVSPCPTFLYGNKKCNFVPKKRKRKMLFREGTLEDTYALQTYPVKATLEKLSKKFGLTIDQLREWFHKRQMEENTWYVNGSSLSRLLLHRKDINFEVGQFAETKTFKTGFRCAWFKCKIRDIRVKENKILPDYYDFPGEEIRWENICQRPPYGDSMKNDEQLMVRPRYPRMYHKSEMPPVDSIAEVCVVIDGAWRIGDLVDWYEDDCYWSATITYLLSNDMVQIEFPKPPAGQGMVYKVFCKDLRPSLEWSPSKGWILPYTIGPNSCRAQLIFPSPQGMDSERAKVASPGNASSTSRISVISSAAPIEEEPVQTQEMEVDGDDVEKASSSDSISTMRVEESKTDDAAWENVDHNIIDLNIMHEDTLEASILDLEELTNRIKWLRGILENN